MNSLFFDSLNQSILNTFWNKKNIQKKSALLPEQQSNLVHEGYLYKTGKILKKNVKRYYYIIANDLYYANVN